MGQTGMTLLDFGMEAMPHPCAVAITVLDAAVTAPGILKNYPDAKKLVTEDCIRPCG